VAPPCTGWCWDGPQGNDLVAVWASSTTDAWAVGDAGTVLHFDGTRWLPVPFPDRSRLVAIAGTGPGSVWVGGVDGLYAWEAGAFVKRAEGMTFALAARGTDVWAGSGNALLHDAGKGFVRIEIPATLRGRVTALAIDGDGSVVAGIERATAPKYQTAALVRVAGTSVAEIAVPPDMDQVITEIDLGRDLVVRTSYPRVWTLAGTTWTSKQATQAPARPVLARTIAQSAARHADVTFMVGERGMLSWFDGRRHDVRSSTIERLGGLARDGATNELVIVSGDGELLRRGPDGFVEVGDAAADRENAYVALASVDGSVFAVRRRMRDDGFSPSHSELVKWFGTGWTKLHPAPNTRIESISARAPDAIWMAGTDDKGAVQNRNPRGVVLRYDGKTVKRIAAAVGPLEKIVALDRTSAWIAGADGIAKLHVSGALTRIELPAVRDLWVDGDDVYAITGREVFLVHDGKAAAMTLPAIDSELRAIAGQSVKDITIVADRDVLHFDGTAWRLESTPSAEDFAGAIYAANGTALIASLRGAVLVHAPR
jgi:hypothetical protein